MTSSSATSVTEIIIIFPVTVLQIRLSSTHSPWTVASCTWIIVLIRTECNLNHKNRKYCKEDRSGCNGVLYYLLCLKSHVCTVIVLHNCCSKDNNEWQKAVQINPRSVGSLNTYYLWFLGRGCKNNMTSAT